MVRNSRKKICGLVAATGVGAAALAGIASAETGPAPLVRGQDPYCSPYEYDDCDDGCRPGCGPGFCRTFKAHFVYAWRKKTRCYTRLPSVPPEIAPYLGPGTYGWGYGGRPGAGYAPGYGNPYAPCYGQPGTQMPPVTAYQQR